METILKCWSWWYGSAGFYYSDMTNGLYYSFYLSAFILVVLYIIKSWQGWDEVGDQIYATFIIAPVCAIATFVIGIFAPIVLIGSVVFLLSTLLGKWGNNYRELARAKEKRREEALATLLKNDPDFMKRYNAINAEMEKILNDL